MRFDRMYFVIILFLLFALSIFLALPIDVFAAEVTQPPVQTEETSLVWIICTIISSVVIPILTLVIMILNKKKKVSDETKDMIDKVAETVVKGIDEFKKKDKAASKNLTSTISSLAMDVATSKELDAYLESKGLNNGQ